jgi:hypothetical protein
MYRLVLHSGQRRSVAACFMWGRFKYRNAAETVKCGRAVPRGEYDRVMTRGEAAQRGCAHVAEPLGVYGDPLVSISTRCYALAAIIIPQALPFCNVMQNITYLLTTFSFPRAMICRAS